MPNVRGKKQADKERKEGRVKKHNNQEDKAYKRN
jgi:hypothetical protein